MATRMATTTTTTTAAIATKLKPRSNSQTRSKTKAVGKSGQQQDQQPNSTGQLVNSDDDRTAANERGLWFEPIRMQARATTSTTAATTWRANKKTNSKHSWTEKTSRTIQTCPMKMCVKWWISAHKGGGDRKRANFFLASCYTSSNWPLTS